MPQFKLLPAIIYACFSRDLYRDAYLRWQGIGLNYLLLLNIVIITPVILVLLFAVERSVLTSDNQLQPAIKTMVDEVTSQIPPMVFEGGKMTTEAAQPYPIYVTANGQKTLFALIDLDGGLVELRKSKAMMLLSSDAVHAAAGNEKIETRYWADMSREHVELDAHIAAAMVEQALAWTTENKAWLMALFGVLSWVGTVLVMMLYRAARAFLFGGIALIVAQVMRFELRYSDAVRLSCLALTPPILLDAVFGLILQDKMSLLLFIVIAIGYLAFAIQSIKQVGRG